MSIEENIARAKELLKAHRPEFILLDIGLPDGNGIEFAKMVKIQNSSQKIIFLSAQNSPDIKLEGLEVGAEDFITKPFRLKELMLRLKKLTTRQVEEKNELTHFSAGALEVWFDRYEAKRGDGEIISLGQKDCEILKLLVENKNTVLARELIIETVWGEDGYPSNRTVDNYIVRLRRWAETDSEAIEILSVRSVGYKLVVK